MVKLLGHVGRHTFGTSGSSDILSTKNKYHELVTTSDDPTGPTGLVLPHTADQRSAVSVAQQGPKPSLQTSAFGIWLVDRC